MSPPSDRNVLCWFIWNPGDVKTMLTVPAVARESAVLSRTVR